MADPTERDQDVIPYGSFAGLRNDVPPERFGPTDLSAAINVDINRSGQLRRRAGFTLKTAGTTHSLWSDTLGTMCYFVRAGQLCRLNADFSSTALASLKSPGSPVSYEKINDEVYFSNGVDTGVIGQEGVRSWGLVPPVLPSVITTLGAMQAGTYQFTATYLRDDGQESGAPLAGTIQLADDSGLMFVIGVSEDPTVRATIIYLSPPNGEDMYAALHVAAGVTMDSYTNDTSELGLPLDKQFLAPAPAGQLVASYRGSTFVAVGDTVFVSEPFAYEQFDLRKYIQFDGLVTMMAALVDKEQSDTANASGFFIGTDKTCGVLVGSAPANFQYVPKTDFGAIPGSLAFVDGSLYADGSAGARLLPMFLTTGGLCIGMPDMQIRNLTRSRYTFPASGRGAAVFMPEPNRYLTTVTP